MKGDTAVWVKKLQAAISWADPRVENVTAIEWREQTDILTSYRLCVYL